jgi:hypothetical protein
MVKARIPNRFKRSRPFDSRPPRSNASAELSRQRVLQPELARLPSGSGDRPTARGKVLADWRLLAAAVSTEGLKRNVNSGLLSSALRSRSGFRITPIGASEIPANGSDRTVTGQDYNARMAALWILHGTACVKLLKAHGRMLHAENFEAALRE